MRGNIFFSGLFSAIFILFSAAGSLQAQEELYIFGVVKDYANSSKLENVKITAYHNGTKVDEYTTRPNGKYEFFLDLGKEYDLEFSRSGWVSKKVYMDSRNIPEEDVGAGFSMNIEMSLFEELEGLDVSILEQPIGKAKYNPNTGALEFDFAYTQKIKDELNRLMREWEKGSKDKQNADSEKEKELQALENEFTGLVESGDKAFLKEEYQQSVADYKEALKLKPDNPMVKLKLQSAEEKLLEQNAAKVAQEKYEAALKAGDDFMRTEEFEKAIGKYNEALGIKQGEKYPQDQIAEANRLIAEKKKREEENARFEELVRKGDNFVKALDFSEAIAKFEEALVIRPDDADVKKKLNDARKAQDEYEANKKLEEEYKAAIAKADASFDSEAYEKSITEYEAALAIKPNESHPKTRIEEARKRIEEILKKEEEERLMAEKQAQYQALVAKGDKEYASEEYQTAVSTYREALEVMPGDKPVEDKIKMAEDRIRQIEEEKALNEKYNLAVKNGDEAFKSDDLERALSSFKEAGNLKPDETYPKEKVKEINDLIAERERIAEEKRKEEEARLAEEKRLAEELARFNSLVEGGDGFFASAKYQEAIDKYEEALKIKPENQHLPNKIKESQRLLDELRAKQDIEQNYKEALAEADRKFEGQNYEGAIKAYERASELKPEEAYPKDQVAAAVKAIADAKAKAEADAEAARKRAEEEALAAKEAEQSKIREQFNKIVKMGDDLMAQEEYKNAKTRYSEALEIIPDDAAVLAKIAEADRLNNLKMGQREVDRQYNMIIADADAAFKAGSWTTAGEKYREAMSVKPEETYPSEKIAEIEQIITEAQRQEEARLAAEQEAERQRQLEEEAQKRQQSESSRQAEIDEEYQTLIEVADRKFTAAEYEIALRNYREASALKPEEFYPKSKIQEIERLRQEEEERLAEEARRKEAEREAERALNEQRRKGSTVDSQTEDEAERFMREARLREEAEKYERIKRLKEEEEARIRRSRSQESEATADYQADIETVQQNLMAFRDKGEESRADITSRIENYKATAEAGYIDGRNREQDKIRRNQQEVDEEKQLVEELYRTNEVVYAKQVEAIDQQFIDQYNYVKSLHEKDNKRRSRAVNEVQEKEDMRKETHERLTERQSKLNEDVAQQKETIFAYQEERMQSERQQIEEAQQEVKKQQQRQDQLSERSQEVISKNQDELAARRQQIEARQKVLSEMADARAKKAREDLKSLRAAEPKEYNDYYLSKLAQDYPQGVTEESDNVGNKVIIRRIVVVGNKADEFRKVIDKTGKYYFKNGNSISELTWNRETNLQFD